MFMLSFSMAVIAGSAPKSNHVQTPTPTPPPTMIEIRQAALDGDAASQYKFGLSYQSRRDFKSAFFWFRKAARQGLAEAQLETGKMMFGGPEGVQKNCEEGVEWISLAANQNIAEAQLRLGDWYEGNKATYVNAFQWLSLAALKNKLLQTKVDTMVLKMSAQEIEEGLKRVNEFKPSPPTPATLGFKLQGLMGSGEKPLALINGKVFEKNEHGTIEVDDEKVQIQCLELSSDSALILVDEESAPILLSMEKSL